MIYTILQKSVETPSNVDKFYMKWASIFGLSIVTAVEGLLSAVNDTIGFLIPTVIIVLVDMISAIALNRRVHRRYPNLVDKTGWKVKSQPLNKAVFKIIKMFSGILIGSFVDQTHVFGTDFGVNTVFIGFILAQLWSILENTSSENDSKWATIAQKVFMNKASRHLNIERSELERLLNEKTIADEINKKLDELSSANINSIFDKSSDSSVEKDRRSVNETGDSTGQRDSFRKQIKRADETKYDLEGFRGILQDLDRQLGDRIKEISESSECEGQGAKECSGDNTGNEGVDVQDAGQYE